jgi:hypothetical protein
MANPRVKYDYKYLTDYCKKHNITLMKDYSKDKVNRDTIIHEKCVYENCFENITKNFRQLCKTGCYCKTHTEILCVEKRKKTCIETYGVEHPSQSEKIKDKKKQTFIEHYGVECSLQSTEVKEKIKQTLIIRFGVEHPSKSEEIKDKKKQTLIEHYGVEHQMYNTQVKEKIKQTCIETYGVENPSQSEKIKEKIKQTFIEHYGVENPMQNKEIREKGKQTCLIKYGVENPMQNKEIREKGKQTCIERFGVEHPLQSADIQEKIKQTCVERFGVEHPNQNPEIAEKASKNSYRSKKYTLPSGKEIQVQGYEPFALNEIIQTVSEDDIITGCSNVPTIAYSDEEGKHHKHFPDIFIPSQNKCIEVKSTWTVEKKNVFLRQNAGKQLGYNYEIWVYNGKGEKVNCYQLATT